MTEDMKKAAELLSENDITFAAVKDGRAIKSGERGVKPLLMLIDGGSTLEGYSAADRVAGNAAAYLYVLLRVKELYAAVISRPALNTLEKYHIPVKYDTLTEAVRNRAGTGFCPMETAVSEAESPENALELIRIKLKSFSQGK